MKEALKTIQFEARSYVQLHLTAVHMALLTAVQSL